jgi:hypothetical protein
LVSSAPFTAALETDLLPEKPFNFISLASLLQTFSSSQKLISEYKLIGALSQFHQILLRIPFLTSLEAENKQDLKELIKSCVDYSVAVKLELEKGNN